MGLNTLITDGVGQGGHARVKDNALCVIDVGFPSSGVQKTRVWSDTLANSAGSTDMGVDGSTTPVKFYTRGDTDNDTYITRMVMLLGYGASAPLYDFADSGSPLTNGVDFGYTDVTGEEVIIAQLKTLYDILMFSLADGHIPTSWELRNLGASNDYGLLAALNVASVMPPYGIQLRGGTKADIFLRINDNCTDADLFKVTAMGFERHE